MPKYLIQQRRVWYAVLEIPKALRPKIGKVRFKETLETESITVAQQRVHTKIGQWKRLIAIIRSGNDDLESKLAEWRMHVDGHLADGLTEDEVKELSLDVSVATYMDDPLICEVHSVVFGDKILLSEHIESWFMTLKTAAKTKDMNRSDVVRFAKKFKYAQDASTKAIVNWVEGDLMEEQRLTEATCRRIISSCRGYWSWLQRKKDLELSLPFEGVVPRKSSNGSKSKRNSRRLSFTKVDFDKLLDASRKTDKALGDLITLGAYTGARIEELCSLKLEQVQSDRFIIQDAKTDAGWREIPIHSQIEALIAELTLHSTDGYLLSGLTSNKYGNRSNAIGKRFGRLKRKLGYGSEHVFHSLSVVRVFGTKGGLS